MTTHTESLTYSTTEITMEVALGVSFVGRVVTFHDHQYTVHSVEGIDWYAFERDGIISLDLGLTPSNYAHDPKATILPMGHELGQGFGQVVPFRELKLGVCLVKAYC